MKKKDVFCLITDKRMVYGQTLKMHTVQVIYYHIMKKNQNITNKTDPAGKQASGVPVPVNPAFARIFTI